MNKKILTIIIITLVFGAIGIGIWMFVGKDLIGDKTNGTNGISGLFPFGGNRGLDIDVLDDDTVDGNFAEEKILARLSPAAITGAASFNDKVRYIEKTTGHIYEIAPQGGERNRISNITILKTFDAVWSYDASKVILRYTEGSWDSSQIQNYSITFGAQSAEATSTPPIQGVFLPKSIKSITPSPDKDKAFYLIENKGETAGIAASFEYENQDQIFSSPFGEFNLSWVNKNIISMLTKPSYGVGGFLYSLNPKTESLNKILSDIKGLTVLWSPSADKIIYGKSGKSGFLTFLYNVESKESSLFSLIVLPEKCVWSKKAESVVYCGVPKFIPKADYPDEWYQGLISFSDSIWKIDISTGATEEIYETDFDAINLFLGGSENYLFFTDKNSGALWSLKLAD